MVLVMIRGGGDLASGVALRLWRAGIPLVITELANPLAVRRTVCFSEAVYDGRIQVEEVMARRAELPQVPRLLANKEIPVLVDPEATSLHHLDYEVVVDARMKKAAPEPLPKSPPLHIGLGPGFRAGETCDVAIETRRGHTLGRAYWHGEAHPDSGQPEGDPRRVVRAPADGLVLGHARIGLHVSEGQLLAEIDVTGHQLRGERTDPPPAKVVSPVTGVLRGLIRSGSRVWKGLKIGDVDPRDDPAMCFLVSDKSMAVGGAVLEAILTWSNKRRDSPPP